MNLLVSITKLRIMKYRGPVSLLISKQSIILPSLFILLSSAVVSSISFLNESTTSNVINITVVKESPVCLAVKIVFYYACEILPTIAVQFVILRSAVRYRKNSNTKLLRKSTPTQDKQTRVIFRSFQLFLIIFICTWSPFAVLSWLRFNTNDHSLLLSYEHLVLCSKITLIAMSPISDGMLQRRKRKANLESIIAFIRKTSYQLNKDQKTNPTFVTGDYSTEQRHQHCDEFYVPSITVIDDHNTNEYSSTKQAKDIKEQAFSELCYRRLKYNLPPINTSASSDVTTSFHLRSFTRNDHTSVKLSPIFCMTSPTSTCSPSPALSDSPRSIRCLLPDTSQKSSQSSDLSSSCQSRKSFDLSSDSLSSLYITANTPATSTGITLVPDMLQQAEIQSTSSLCHTCPPYTTNTFSYFSFSPKCFTPGYKSQRRLPSFAKVT